MDLRLLLNEVKQDLVGHSKLRLLSNYEGEGIWDHYRLLKIYYCKINTPFYPIDNTHHCSYYLLQNDDEKVRHYQ